MEQIPPPPLIEESFTANKYEPENLKINTIYYWKVISKDKKGLEISSDIWNFKTKEETDTIETWTNSIGITFVKIPAGDFIMGSPKPEGYKGFFHQDNKQYPTLQHNVTISNDFYLSQTEITKSQYHSVYKLSNFSELNPNKPRTHISWKRCAEFCNKLSKNEGLEPCYKPIFTPGIVDYRCNFSADGYRLPTEAEWEYACRANTTTRYYWGDEMNDDYAWYCKDKYQKRISIWSACEVGKKLPNFFGLYDMIGNVSEWCNDRYGRYYYSESPSTDPRGPFDYVNYISNNTNYYRVCRGGNNNDSASQCSSAARGHQTFTEDYNPLLGFRIACNAEDE